MRSKIGSTVGQPVGEALTPRPVTATGVALLMGAVAMSALVGCASSPRAAVAPELERSGVASAQVQGSGMANMNMAVRVESKTAILDLAPEKAFAAIEGAYATLGIPITDRDPTKRLVGNTNYRGRRKIGDVVMTKVVDCGGDMGMPNAETYQVQLSILSVVKPNDAGGSVVETVVEGTARNPVNNASNSVRCSSAGGLEARLVALAKGQK